MQFKQIINIGDTLAHFTGDKHGGGNVYDEDNVHTLVNNNATLGVTGQSNSNWSNGAINLKGGYLQLLDTTFNETNVADSDFMIAFSFRVPDRVHTNPIAGFKTLVSKWNPEQEYMVGFENGIIVAKIQTAAGVVELEFDYPQMIYNNRWNFVVLRVQPATIELIVNGTVVSVGNVSALVGSTNSLFTVGGVASEAFGEDVLINDIVVLNDNLDSMPRSCYILTRSYRDIWLDYAPTHYFDVAGQNDITKPVVNQGSAGGLGYLVYDLGGTQPYKWQPYTDHVGEVVRMPGDSWFTIDQTLNLDFDAGMTMVFRGDYEEPGTSATASNKFRICDLRNNMNDDNGRFLVSYNYYNSSSNRYFGWNMHNADGSFSHQQASYNTPAIETADTHYEYGVKMMSFKAGVFDSASFPHHYTDPQKTYNGMPYSYGQTLPFESNQFWFNDGTESLYSDLGEWGLFGYAVPQDFGTMVNTPRFHLSSQLIIDKYLAAGFWFWSYGNNVTTPLLSSQFVTYAPTSVMTGTYPDNIVDAQSHRQNEWLQSGFLASAANTTGPSASADYMIPGDDFTMNVFLWNRNTTTAYEVIHFHNDLHLQVNMNQRDGVFSYGDVEVSMDRMAVGQTLSTFNQTFKDNGFHMLTIVRKGYEIQVWVDGQLTSSMITASIYSMYDANAAPRIKGGPLYFNDWGLWKDIAMTPVEIEYMFGGFNDILSGQSTLDGAAMPTTLLATDTVTGDILKTYATGADGKFKFELPKSSLNTQVNILAIAQNDNDSNNVVVHGPYNLNTVYSKFSEEVLTQTLSDMVLDMEPYAYYKMDDVFGSTITDYSGNARHGTIVGGVTLGIEAMASGLYATDFNGVDGFIDLPDGYDDMSNGFTVEAWMNYDSYEYYSRVFEFASGSSSQSQVTLTNYGSTGGVLFAANGSVEDTGTHLGLSTWQHFVGRFAPDGTFSVWLNGVKITEATGQALPANVLRTFNSIGSANTTRYYNGQMSNFATYVYPLSDEDIEKHAKRGFGYTAPTTRAAILQDDPDLYFSFDRGAEEYTDVIDGAITLGKNGSFVTTKNSLGINVASIANNWLTTPSHRLSDSGEGWAIEVMVKTASTHTKAAIVSEWDQATDAGTFKLEIDTSNKFKFYAVNNATLLTSTTSYNDDLWHHIVITHSDGVTTMYIDGASEATLGVTHSHNLHNLSVGNTSDGHADTYCDVATYVDDLAIYSHSLSAVRITEHYNRFVKKKVYQ